MIIAVGVLLVCLLLLFLAVPALVDLSRRKLEKYCSTRRPARLGEILESDDETLYALQAWAWLAVGALAWTLFSRPILADFPPWLITTERLAIFFIGL